MTPDEFTNDELMLDVGDGHKLYVHDWGKANVSSAVLYLHGGPGAGSKDKYKGQFDPKRQRVIFFDQRGSGRSIPTGSLENNTTAHVLRDIDKILDHFGMDKVILTGGSWGSTLALFYGIDRPERVLAMVLDGIWTASKRETSWIEEGGYRTFYPDVWQNYLASTPLKFRDNPTSYHFKRILGDDLVAAKASGITFQTLEGSLIGLDDRFTPSSADEFDPSGIRIEVHYQANGCFMPDRHVFDNASKLTMPIYMVQGRYDMVCPPETAYELNNLLPNSELIWTTSGHRAERESWNVKRTILAQLTGGQ